MNDTLRRDCYLSGLNRDKLTKEIIDVPQDYNFELNLGFLTRSEKEILHVIDESHIYKAIRVNGSSILIRITPAGRKFEISFPLKAPGIRERKLVVSYVREWFDVDNDLTQFYALASKDKLLKDSVKNNYGYRIIGLPDLFEALCWAVIGQQINLSFAYTLKQRFVENFGEHIDWKGRKYFLFPAPEIVSGLTDTQLLSLQFSRQKSNYVRLIGEAFRDNVISKESISKMTFHEARQKLMTIKGVGNWTANYALMKTFRYPEAFPLEDAGLHNAIKNIRKLAKKPSPEEVKQIFRRYKGWEAYATLYLWKTL
jgi:DNA-3-methyladenine glycosylase II